MPKNNLLTLLITIFALLNTLNTQPIDEQVDKQTYYIQQFARTMSDFVPSETFTFNLDAGEQQNFLIWPSQDIEKVRGVFYIDNSQDPEAASGNGFSVECELNGVIKKNFFNERLGVFNFKIEDRPSNMKLIMKSQDRPLSIYLSYELKKTSQNGSSQNINQNVPTKQEQQFMEKKSKIQEVTKKFEKVRISVEGQEHSLRRILKLIGKHSKRLQNEINYAHHRIFFETLVVIISGIASIWVIRKQITSGYELLV